MAGTGPAASPPTFGRAAPGSAARTMRRPRAARRHLGTSTAAECARVSGGGCMYSSYATATAVSLDRQTNAECRVQALAFTHLAGQGRKELDLKLAIPVGAVPEAAADGQPVPAPSPPGGGRGRRSTGRKKQRVRAHNPDVMAPEEEGRNQAVRQCEGEDRRRRRTEDSRLREKDLGRRKEGTCSSSDGCVFPGPSGRTRPPSSLPLRHRHLRRPPPSAASASSSLQIRCLSHARPPATWSARRQQSRGRGTAHRGAPG